MYLINFRIKPDRIRSECPYFAAIGQLGHLEKLALRFFQGALGMFSIGGRIYKSITDDSSRFIPFPNPSSLWGFSKCPLVLLLLLGFSCYAQSALAQAVTFNNTPYSFTLSENANGSAGPVTLGTVEATHSSTVHSNEPGYSLDDGSSKFSIADSGVVTYTGSGEDASTTPAYTFTITVTFTFDPGGAEANPGTQSLTDTTAITITILPNNPPEFETSAYTFSLNENESGTIAIGTVRATDADSTSPSYILSAGNTAIFSINTDGVVSYIGTGEDYETPPNSYTLTVQATDSNSTALFANAMVTVDIDNINDNAPGFESSAYTFSLNENQSGTFAIGTVRATDADSTSPSHTLSAGNTAIFSINTDGVVSYIGTGEDYETPPNSYTLTVQATDSNSTALFANAMVTVDIDNINDNAPGFESSAYTFSLNENQSGTFAIGTVRATDDDGTTPSHTLSAGNTAIFSVNTDGVVSYIGTGEDFASASNGYTLTVRASDGASADVAEVVVTINNINDNPPVFNPSEYAFSLNENQSGTFAIGTVRATDADGITPSHTLSAGNTAIFSVNTDGVVSYIGSGEDADSTTTSYTLTVRASDGASADVADVVVTISNINDNSPEFETSAYTLNLSENQSGVPTAFPIGTVRATDADGPTPSYSLIVGSTLLFSVNTDGVVSYIGSGEDYETLPNSYTLTVQATDSGGLTAGATVLVIVIDQSESPIDISARTRAVEGMYASWSRIIATDAADMVSGRLSEVVHTTVMNRPLGWELLAWNDVGSRWDGVEKGFKIKIPKIRLQDLLYSSSFLLPLNADSDGSSSSDNQWHVWGRGRVTHVERKEAGLDYDTELHSYHVGTDYQWSSAVLVGLALSYSQGEGEVVNAAQERTEVDLELSSVYQYVNVSLREGLDFWGLGGFGRGETEVKDANGRVQTDTGMQMVALGMRSELLSSEMADISFKLDARTIELTSDAVSGQINATSVRNHRLRLAVAAQTDHPLSASERLITDAELGGRLDGGDADTGEGLELGLGIRYTHTGLRLGVDARGRWLLAHRDDSRKEWGWGTGLALYLQANALGRGLSLSWKPGWGGSLQSQVGSLWQNGVPSLGSESAPVTGMSWKPHRQQLALGYGWGTLRGLLTPFAEMELSRDLDRLRLGTRFALPLGGLNRLQLSLHGDRHLTVSDDIHHKLGLDVSLDF